ncbi:hypothetical protein SAMN05216464_101407 [Mucilaginibacter pineti]|uniref:PKD domain-containing protein n=1 Tax=Mucilaginibacter pineti TaxID=1391627 RepID=A0A1G6TT48_9SPHI|nr:hypothetical protein [Mucilaginibacter pineti]SDD32283.1 hypothetical protein SAMN05216464_101407 [Mucilaginibacter pineti]
MKNFTYTILAMVLAFFLIQSCNKMNDPANNGKIVATKTLVKIYELDSLSLVGTTTQDSVQWSVSPSGFNGLSHQGGRARVLFTKAGSYTVTASKIGGIPASIVIKVSADSVSNPTHPIDTPVIPIDSVKITQLTGDQITLHPSIYQKTDSVGVQFNAITTNLYCSRGTLQYNATVSPSKSFVFDFLNVRGPIICTGTSDIPMVISPLPLWKIYMGNGTYPLKATLNGTTYTGSIIVSATTVTFDWNYTSGIVIAPKVFNR